LFEEGLAIDESLGDHQGVAIYSFNLGAVALDQGDYAAAGRHQEKALTIQQELGDQGAWPACSRVLARTIFTSDGVRVR
jgi:hypothetical protein